MKYLEQFEQLSLMLAVSGTDILSGQYSPQVMEEVHCVVRACEPEILFAFVHGCAGVYGYPFPKNSVTHGVNRFFPMVSFSSTDGERTAHGAVHYSIEHGESQ